MYRSLLKNAASQVVSRLLLSLGRLVAALLIARNLGTERFGEYALVVYLLVLFEWLVDFGQTDIAVREICQQPGREPVILRALAVLKAMQGLLMFLLLPCVVYALDYPPQIVRAALIGGIGLPFYAAVQVLRTQFKVRMTMEKDALGELGGLVVMLPLTWYACSHDAGVEILVACYMISRLVFLLLLLLLGQVSFHSTDSAGTRAEVLRLVRQALPLGVAGLLVAIYDGLALMILSKTADMTSVAQYAAATRYVFPVIIIVQSLNSAFYPPLSATWRAAPSQFASLQQTVLEVSILVGAAIFCAVYAGAGFLMSLLGPSMGEAAGLLQLLAWVVLARTVTTAMSPLIVVAGRQGKALWLAVASVLLQLAALIVLVPRFGVTGAAIGYLTIELVLGVVPISLIGQYVARVRVQWSAPARLLGSAVFAVGICDMLPFAGTLASGMLAFALFLALAVASGGASPNKLRGAFDQIVNRRQILAAPVVAGLEETEV